MLGFRIEFGTAWTISLTGLAKAVMDWTHFSVTNRFYQIFSPCRSFSTTVCKIAFVIFWLVVPFLLPFLQAFSLLNDFAISVAFIYFSVDVKSRRRQ